MDDILDFYRNIDSIKHKEREGWNRIGIKGTKDTIASHSYGAALIAWIVSKQEGFDVSKMIKMLLIHDIIMAYLEDYTPKDSEFNKKRAIENSFSDNLLKTVPDEIRQEFTALFLEYQEEKTELSKLARECDKLDTILQAYMYSERLGKDNVSEFIKTNKNKVRSKTGKEIIKSIQRSFNLLL